MKPILTLAILLAAAPLLSAQAVVTNPISDVLAEEMHLEDLTKWVQSIENQVQQINALTQQLQQVRAYVKAFGDPEKLLSIVGADQLISSLQQSGSARPSASSSSWPPACRRCKTTPTDSTKVSARRSKRRAACRCRVQRICTGSSVPSSKGRRTSRK